MCEGHDRREAKQRDSVKDMACSPVAFPLTLTLSLREREQQRALRGLTNGLRFADRLAEILPFPKGEGRGEGEERCHNSRTPSDSSTRFRICLSHTAHLCCAHERQEDQGGGGEETNELKLKSPLDSNR
jgi:hypothetical protein